MDERAIREALGAFNNEREPVEEIVRRIALQLVTRNRDQENWKRAVIGALMTRDIYSDRHATDPRAALDALIEWEIRTDRYLFGARTLSDDDDEKQ